MGRRKMGGRFQTGHDYDGQNLRFFMRTKGPQRGDSRAVKRDLTTKAIKWWARSQLRVWKGAWEIYKPMMEEIEQMMKAGAFIEDIETAVMKRIKARSVEAGTEKALRYMPANPVELPRWDDEYWNKRP